MFEASKKAAAFFQRLMAAAAIPALSVLALSLLPRTQAQALYLLENKSTIQVNEQKGAQR